MNCLAQSQALVCQFCSLIENAHQASETCGSSDRNHSRCLETSWLRAPETFFKWGSACEQEKGPAPQKIHSASWPPITFFPQPGPKWNSSVTFHCLNPKNLLPEPQKSSVTCVQKNPLFNTRALFFSLYVTWAPGLPQEVSPSAASTPSMLSWVSCSWDNIQLSAKDWSKLVGT